MVDFKWDDPPSKIDAFFWGGKSTIFFWGCQIFFLRFNMLLGGGSKYFLFSSLLGEMIKFD